MVRTIPKRIISILMVCLLSFMLCLAVPKYQVKASLVGEMTIEIGMALIAILGAFGIDISLPDGLSDDEILSVIGQILPINKTYTQWKQDIAISEEGKIYASQDLVNQLLDKFYNHIHDNNLVFSPVSASSGVTVAFNAIDNTDIIYYNDYMYNVGETITSGAVAYCMNGYNFYSEVYAQKDNSNLKYLSDEFWSTFKDILTTRFSYVNDYYYYIETLGYNSDDHPHPGYYMTLSVAPFSRIIDKTVTDRSHSYGRVKYNLDSSYIRTKMTIWADGAFATNAVSSVSTLFNGYYSNSSQGRYLCSNLGALGSYAYISQSAVLDRFWNPSLNSINLDRIYSYIGSCVGLSIYQSATATDTITIGLADDAIDYPLSGTGVVVDTGVIAQDLDGWIEGVQEKVVTRDIPAEGTASRATDFELSRVIAQPTALDFTDTADYAAEESLPASYSANNNITLLNGIGSFFPFCIPFDLYEIFNGLNAPAQVPRFNWSIDFRSFGMGKHDFVIDLSNFATVCLIFKILTFIGFLIFLTLKTRDLIRG